MRRLTLCFALILVGASSGCRKTADAPPSKIMTGNGRMSFLSPGPPTETKAGNGRVSVLFPGAPTETKEGVNSIYSLKPRGSNGCLLFSPAALSADLTDKEVVRQLFDAVQAAGVRSLGGEVVRTEDVRIGKYPGRTFDVEISIGILRKGLYLTGKDMIHISAIGPKDFVDGPDAKKFLESLKIEE